MEVEVSVVSALGNQDRVNSERYMIFEQYAAISPQDSLRILTIMSQAIFCLGFIVLILSRIYEVISGSLEGSYDPTDLIRQQAQEAEAHRRP